MRALLLRFVDLRQGELRPLLSVSTVLFLLIAAHTMMETARDALFLGKLSASQLPLVYLGLAVSSLLVSRWVSRFGRRFGRRNALTFTLLFCAYGTALLYLQEPTKPIVFGLYLWSGLLGTVLILQFWMLAGQAFSVGQGKRLFGPMAAGGVLGAVVGASLSAGLLAFIDVTVLLLVASGVFLSTAGFVTTLQLKEDVPKTSAQELAVKTRGDLSVFREQPYLRKVGAVIALSTATVLTTDYLFKFVAAERIPADELGSFFALYYAGLNAAALVVQLGFTGWLVRRLGVTSALCVTPLLLAAGGLASIATGGVLAAVLLTKGADGSLRHSLHRVTTELLYLPLSSDVRERAKPLVDTLLGRGVQAATAAGIFVLGLLGASTPTVLAGILAGLAMLWLAAAVMLRRPYLDLFRQALFRESLAGEPGETLDLGSVEAVMEALSSRDPERVIAAMEILEENRRSRLIPGLILYHESELVLERALAVIGTPDRKDWVPLAERLLSHDSDSVRQAAVRALAAAGERKAVEKGLSDRTAKVRMHAAFSLIQHDPDAKPEESPAIREMLRDPERAGEEQARSALIDAIATSGDRRWLDALYALRNVTDAIDVERFARAVARMPESRFLPGLIERLRVRNGRDAVREAIVAMGEPALDELMRLSRDPKTPLRIRTHLPRTISKFKRQAAADFLTERLSSEPMGRIRYKVLRGLGKLTQDLSIGIDRARIEKEARRNLLEHLRLVALLAPLDGEPESTDHIDMESRRVLLGLLDDKRRQSLERAFRCLQIAHRSEDLRSVYQAITGDDSRLRASALEFLDALTFDNQQTRELFRLVADDLTSAECIERARPFLESIPKSYEEALKTLLADSDQFLAAIAAQHALDLGLVELRPAVLDEYKRRPMLRMVERVSLIGDEAHA